MRGIQTHGIQAHGIQARDIQAHNRVDAASLINFACNSPTAGRVNASKTAEFQRYDFKS